MGKELTLSKQNGDIQELEKIFEGDLDVLLFYLSWLKNGLNATKAYKELHPHVTNGSAEVLGSRVLGKVRKEQVALAYGLDVQKYFEQLRDGLGATKWNDFTGEREADHKTRRSYHEVLGRLLSLEEDQRGGNVNVGIIVNTDQKKYGF